MYTSGISHTALLQSSVTSPVPVKTLAFNSNFGSPGVNQMSFMKKCIQNYLRKAVSKICVDFILSD